MRRNYDTLIVILLIVNILSLITMSLVVTNVAEDLRKLAGG